MKRCTLGLLLVALALTTFPATAHAGKMLDRLREQRQKYPPKWKLSTMSPYYVDRDKEGDVRVRQVYPGFAEHFAPPAMFYYGYPHSGDDTGIGPLWW